LDRTLTWTSIFLLANVNGSYDLGRAQDRDAP
jgi:hypothetical protein